MGKAESKACPERRLRNNWESNGDLRLLLRKSASQGQPLSNKSSPSGFVSGHGFSRAEKALLIEEVLTPEEALSTRTGVILSGARLGPHYCRAIVGQAERRICGCFSKAQISTTAPSAQPCTSSRTSSQTGDKGDTCQFVSANGSVRRQPIKQSSSWTAFFGHVILRAPGYSSLPEMLKRETS